MEIIKAENFTFTYPTRNVQTLTDINLSINSGEFITVCGKSGCGKTTLLRQMKPVISPHGEKTGRILYCGSPIEELSDGRSAAEIGFVLQNPESQLVTDMVWHELAFGLESLGLKTPEIRARVAETASFFGIEGWFHKKVSELSGGQKQLLNLAAITVMQPKLLILDEPTSRLDPIAAKDFLQMLSRLNRELSVTVILAEHRLEDAFSISDRVLVMDGGRIIADGTPQGVGKKLSSLNHDMLFALPTAMRVHAAITNDYSLPFPVTVREGRNRLLKRAENGMVLTDCISASDKHDICDGAPSAELSEVWFRYEKGEPDILRGLSLKVYRGELLAIVGGNGVGKSTALSVLCGLFTPDRGRVLYGGRCVKGIPDFVGMLPQNPQSVFVKDTVLLDLFDVLSESALTDAEKSAKVNRVMNLCELTSLAKSHPLDLSGGEMQKAALAKVLLRNPSILLLDEPAKGLDAHAKQRFAAILKKLTRSGTAIVMVSHDIEFCTEYADRCAMFFDGGIVSEGNPREFFSGKSFYTTSANRMSRGIIKNAVLADDIILACGGKLPIQDDNFSDSDISFENKGNSFGEEEAEPSKNEPVAKANMDIKKSQLLSPLKITVGVFAGLLFVLSLIFLRGFSGFLMYAIQFSQIVLFAVCLVCFFPRSSLFADSRSYTVPEALSKKAYGKSKRKQRINALIAISVLIVLIPATVFCGLRFFGERKYLLTSLAVIFETLIPFFMLFEGQKHSARRLVTVSVLCALAVAGRIAFAALPQFKPLAAVVIIAGVCFGAETGFLTGAVSAFVSNFFFGQGPWTPWQMTALGLVGFIAGALFFHRQRRSRLLLCICGAVSVLVIYGGIMNPASVLMWQDSPTLPMLLASYAAGFPFDVVHSAATAFFLWFFGIPMMEKLDRVMIKYGE